MTAKEMFEKLDYKVNGDEYKIIIYKTNVTGAMLYSCVFYNTNNKKFRLKIYEQYMSLELLQAINKQIEELGWNKC